CLGLIGMGLFPAIGLRRRSRRTGSSRSIRPVPSGPRGLGASEPVPAPSSSLPECRASIRRPTPWCRIRKHVSSRPSSISRRLPSQKGASLQDCVRLTVYVSDLHRYAPMVEKAQAELSRSAPSATHHDRGAAPVRRRYRRDRQRFLRTAQKVSPRCVRV